MNRARQKFVIKCREEDAKREAFERLWEALLFERYEDCGDLIEIARKNGAESGEIKAIMKRFAEYQAISPPEETPSL